MKHAYAEHHICGFARDRIMKGARADEAFAFIRDLADDTYSDGKLRGFVDEAVRHKAFVDAQPKPGPKPEPPVRSVAAPVEKPKLDPATERRRKASAYTPEQIEEFEKRERDRLRKCKKLAVTLPASIVVGQTAGWREDPLARGCAFHPSEGYVRWAKTHGNQKIGKIALTVGPNKRAGYQVRGNRGRAMRYPEHLMYDCGFSSMNPYV